MFLLLQGAHYELAVPKDSIKEKYTIELEDNNDDQGYKAEDEDDDLEQEPPKTTEQKLEDMEKKFNKLKNDHIKSLDQIKSLKIRVKSLTNQLSAQKDSDNDNSTTEDEDTLLKSKSSGYKKTNPQSEAERILKCEVCKVIFNKERVWKTHMEKHNEDGDWTCGEFECNFQTNRELNLREHKKRMHKAISNTLNQNVRNIDGKPKGNSCNTCGENFVYKIDLNKHVTKAHMTYKPCRNIQTCTYAPKCRYNHKEYPVDHQVCFECGKSFKTMHELMRHRKISHKVPLCKLFLKNSCGFSADDCYNTHSKASEPVKKATNNINEGFWEVPRNTAPPLIEPKSQKGPTQEEWHQMKQALAQINNMMKKFQ